MGTVEGPTEAVTEATLDDVAFDARGLVVAIVQNVEDGEVRMVGHMNREALARTLDSGPVWFWGRSREAFQRKGETSDNTLATVEVLVDCDAAVDGDPI